MTVRRFWAIPIALVALAAGGVELAVSGSAASAAWATLAGLLAAAVAALAISLPGVDWRGLVFGGLFVGAGILSWTYTDRPLIVWSVLLIEGFLFMWWSWPWWPRLRTSFRMGTAWLGTSMWILGVIGALLVLHAGIAGQRLLYAGVFGLAVLAVMAKSERRDLSVGIVAAFLFAIAALFLVGSGNLFEDVHTVPANDWGHGFEYRFWGGPSLLYHPNSMAGIAVLVAIRVGIGRSFAVWQRLAVVALAGFIISVTNSRTGFIFFVAAAVVHAVLLWRRLGADRPDYSRRWVAAATPFVALALVLVSAHGVQFLTQERYGASAGVTSGRLDTWKQVLTDWRDASIAEKAFGDARTVRSTVYREESGSDIKLTVDNAAFGALRHGGVVGVLAFLVGLGLLLWNVWRRLPLGRASPEPASSADGPAENGSPADGSAERGPTPAVPAWYVLAVVSALPTIATTEWLLGGTGGTMWILLVAGEAVLFAGGNGGLLDRGTVPPSKGRWTSTVNAG
jgi:hypothetical protein